MSDQAASSHGLDPSPEITAKDGAGAFAGTTPPAGSADPAAAPDAGKTQPIGGADGQQPFYRPKELPDHYLGQTLEETMDKMAAGLKSFRDAQAKGAPKAPEKPDAYKLTLSEKAAGYLQIPENDPALQTVREVAHQAQMTEQQFGVFGKFVDMMVDKGLIEKPYDADAMMKGLVPEGFRGSEEQKLAEGAKIVAAADNWIKAAAQFDEAEKTELRLLTTSKAGLNVLNKLMTGNMAQTVAPGGQGAASAVSQADLDARVADPRNNAFDAKYDEAFALETRELFKRLHGG